MFLCNKYVCIISTQRICWVSLSRGAIGYRVATTSYGQSRKVRHIVWKYWR